MSKRIVEEAFGIPDAKKITDLSVVDIFRGISRLEQERYCDADGQRITMVIGSTRCGKSTTLNLLLGNPLVSKEQNDGGAVTDIILVKKNADPGNLYPVIGNRTTSETSLPTKYELDGLQLWDCPGFGDSRGAQQEIINAWFINRLFQTASEVKLINLCAATSFAVKTSSNVTEFTNYIKQILDIFGKENIAKVKQLLVFTKTNPEKTVDQYRTTFSKLINEHFPSDPEVLQFFREARVTKIDEVKEVGLEFTDSYIQNLTSLYFDIPYQKMTPHIGVDYRAKVFLHEEVLYVAKVAMDNMKDAYKEAYNSTMVEALEGIYKRLCNGLDLEKAIAQYQEAQMESQRTAETLPIIQKEEDTIHKIKAFVHAIIQENTALDELIDTSLKACKIYNYTVMNYEADTRFLQYLKENSSKFTSKEAYQKEWDIKLTELAKYKPKFSDLTRDLEDLKTKSEQVTVDLQRLPENGKNAATQKILEMYKAELNAAQEKFQKDSEAVQKQIEEAKTSFWNLIPIVGPIIALICKGKTPTAPDLKQVTEKAIEMILDKTFGKYIEEDQKLLGDHVHQYFEDGHA